jgi:hypothetical protein
MSVRSVLVAGIAAVLMPFAAFAETHQHPGAKVQFDTPDSWEAKADGDVLNVESPDGEAAIMFAVVEGGALKEAVEAGEKELNNAIKDAKTAGEAQPVEINGMKGEAIEGTGTVEGEAVEWGELVLETKSGKYLFVLGIAKKGGKHQKEIDALFQSIKAL